MRDFLDITSHELRHPITIIKGYAASLRTLAGCPDDPRIKEMLIAIEKGAGSARRSLPQTGKNPAGLLRVGDHDHIGGAPIQPDLSPRGGLAGCSDNRFDQLFQLQLHRLDQKAMGIYARGLQLTILLENAITFSRHDSPATVEVHRGESSVTVSVLDRGEGVAEKERKRIFEPLHQIESARHHSKPGMGLGLQ
jgi:two-component system phosphate regulon sensor histidine kinase PhoR